MMHRSWRITAWGLGGFVALAAWGGSPLPAFGQGEGFVQPLGVVPARQAKINSTLTLVATVKPLKRSIIASEVAGVVEVFPVEEGDLLEAGAVIGQLRARTRQLALDAGKARLELLENELQELRNGTRQEEKDRAKAAMEEARALLNRWQTEMDRLDRLKAEGFSAAKEYNDAAAEVAAARQRLYQAQAEYELAEAGPRQEDIVQAEIAAKVQQLLNERMAYDLTQCTIKAPFAGYVTVKHTEIGSWVTQGGPVVDMIDLTKVLVRVDVPQSAIAACRVGTDVTVMIEGFGRNLSGVIKHVIPEADEKARTFPVEVELANKDQALRSGMFVRAIIPTGEMSESVIVPRDAVLQRGGSHWVVMVVPAQPPMEGTMAMPMPVQLGARAGDWVAVRSAGLAPTVPVAVKGHDRVFGPMPVTPVPARVAEPEGVELISIPAAPPATAPAN